MRQVIRKVLLVFSAIAMMGQSPISEETKKLARLAETKELTGLTEVGAEAAANHDGSIPEFDNSPITVPAKWRPGMHYQDPFSEDKAVQIISASNLGAHSEFLTLGQQALLKQKKGYQLKVFHSRRSARYPDHILRGSKNNIKTARLINEGNGITDFDQGFPFVHLSNDKEIAGKQALWNHLLRYRGGQVERQVLQATIDSGTYIPFILKQRYARAETLSQSAQPSSASALFYYMDQVISPARMSGNIVLVHESVDALLEPRKAWIYSKAYKRMRRAPSAAYDAPIPGTFGLRTADSYDMFNGALDRYNWRYRGKRELYVPYNAYALASGDVTYDDILLAENINPQLMRWEKHRVHVIEADLKAGSRHIYGKRIFYLDEDTWTIVLAEYYDNKGELWRVAEGHMINYYDRKLPYYVLEVVYDLQDGRYVVFGLMNEERQPYRFDVNYKMQDFTPSAVRRFARG